MGGGGNQRAQIDAQQKQADREFRRRERELQRRERDMAKEQAALRERMSKPLRVAPPATPAHPVVSGASRDARRRASRRQGYKGTIFAGETGGLGGSSKLNQQPNKTTTLFAAT